MHVDGNESPDDRGRPSWTWETSPVNDGGLARSGDRGGELAHGHGHGHSHARENGLDDCGASAEKDEKNGWGGGRRCCGCGRDGDGDNQTLMAVGTGLGEGEVAAVVVVEESDVVTAVHGGLSCLDLALVREQIMLNPRVVVLALEETVTAIGRWTKVSTPTLC
ncbi:hypothetical protein B0T21DRAFT_410118 [Apiosordaria backusii]|uniref:Uncharacterized protein n=1 Tax=Apiosordaria backusii TaxID=314023 RepID=A0AA40EIA0_9PEZI|nr:hypothetical protein B0T21DRAFT_410118 [Apiosordaria backusii]